MARYTSELINTLDDSRLTGNHVRVISAAVLGDMLEFFDLALISFVIAFIAVPWGLTYTASASILLAAGVGSIVGAILFGNMRVLHNCKITFFETENTTLRALPPLN